jgi:hypothetical protein
MSEGLAIILGFTLYKVTGLLIGAFSCWLGYQLFRNGLWNSAGDVTAKYSKASIVIKSAAPGTFFAILGAGMMIAVVWKGYDLNAIGSNGMHYSTKAPPAEVAQTMTDVAGAEAPKVDLP